MFWDLLKNFIRILRIRGTSKLFTRLIVLNTNDFARKRLEDERRKRAVFKNYYKNQNKIYQHLLLGNRQGLKNVSGIQNDYNDGPALHVINMER